MMTYLRAATVMAILLGWPGTLHAAEWRYCFSPTPDGQRFLMSMPFASSDASRQIEGSFDRFLGAQGIEGALAACPRAPDREMLVQMMGTAAAYNRENGRSIVTLPWPGDAVAAH